MGGRIEEMENWRLVLLVIVAPPALIVAAFLIAESLETKQRFSLRDLLLTITVAALILGWITYAVRK